MTSFNSTSGMTTRLLHSGYDPQLNHGAVIPPLHLSTTFIIGNEHEYEYSRSGNPTREILETTLAALDDAAHALAYSSGTAALANIAALLETGQEILFSSDAYGGTYRHIVEVASVRDTGYQVVDFTDLAATAAMLAAHPIKLVWLETPTNPLLKVVDIAAVADLAHKHGAILAVDNTFATPFIQKPLALGADIVTYSTTKYLNGHSDSIGGSLAVNDEKLFEKLQFLQNAIGAMLSPFDSWLTLRGMRTLELRMAQHVKNTQVLVELLNAHPNVEKVYYPGLFTDQQAEIVARQMHTPGAMISIQLQPHCDVQKFIATLQYFPLAVSLGGVESLINHPSSMTHASIPPEEREKIGLSDSLLRISVGIENTDDLVTDMQAALDSLTT
jgi:cystathionine gamma-synthase